MLVEDIRHMRAGRRFRIFEGLDKKSVMRGPVDPSVFNRYYDFYDCSRVYGLPGGKGWANETPFAMKILRHYERLTQTIKNWNMEKAAK